MSFVKVKVVAEDIDLAIGGDEESQSQDHGGACFFACDLGP